MTLKLFFRLLKGRAEATTVLLIPTDRNQDSEQYTTRPRVLRLFLIAVIASVVLVTGAIVAFTPLGDMLRGRNMDQMLEDAITNSLRISQFEDSLQVQREHAEIVANLLGVSIGNSEESAADGSLTTGNDDATALHPEPTINWTDHEQPALPVNRMPAAAISLSNVDRATRDYLSGLRLPFNPPVDGFITRGFSARNGHFAVDIAVEEGTLVRAVGGGYVILADWGYDGGWTIGIQHAGGYVSIYKHNGRLMKRVGDRILGQEPIAISGNSGEITSGPHIHFELWQEGLAQDPKRYFLK